MRHLDDYLKSDQLNRKALQHIALQLQNDFALLRYLLFSAIGVTHPNVHSSSHLAVSLTNKPHPNPILAATLVPTVAEPSTFRFTPEGAVGGQPEREQPLPRM